MASLVLILYLMFLILYLAFNAYIINRAWEMKIKGDWTQQAIYIFTGVVIFIIIVSIAVLIGILSK